MRKYPPTQERFWPHVTKSEGCWLWSGSMTDGYGRIRHRGTDTLAHRLSYEWTYGAFDPKWHVLHKCNTPACVRPEHLYLGTPAENTADKVAAGHHRGDAQRRNTPRGERVRGAKLTAEKVLALRAEHAAGVGRRELAERYGVARVTVDGVLRRRTWKHLPEAANG